MKKRVILSSACALLGVVGCKSRVFNASAVKNGPQTGESTAPIEQTACISLQGNGHFFPSLVGEVVALMERNINPVVVHGGSSASLTAAFLRGTLTNESVINTLVTGPNGSPLGVAQKAALVLASSMKVAETVIFLPSVNKIGTMVWSMFNYVGMQKFADSFGGFPSNELAHVEAITGQGTLLADFVMNENFADVLAEPNFAKRSELMLTKWIKFADLLPVTPGEFVAGLMTPSAGKNANEKAEKIKARYFGIFRAENTKPSETPEAALKRYNGMLNTFKIAFDTVIGDKQRLESLFISGIQAIRVVPFVGSLANTAAKPFLMPSPERIWNAYQGMSVKGKPLKIPSGIVMHTTARMANKNVGGLWEEKVGLNYFYQGYFVSPDLQSEYEKLRAGLAADRSFLEFPEGTSGKFDVVLPKSQILVFDQRSLPEAIKTSIGEPNAFRRDPINLNKVEIARNGIDIAAGTMVSYGGWMDHMGLSTLKRLGVCAKADFLAQASTRSDGLYDFQRQSIRPVIEGATESVTSSTLGKAEDPNSPVIKWLTKLQKYLDYSQVQAGSKGNLFLSFNWDKPSPLTGDVGKKMDAAFHDSRFAHFLIAYQHVAEELAGKQEISYPGNQLLYPVIGQPRLAAITDPLVLTTTVEQMGLATAP